MYPSYCFFPYVSILMCCVCSSVYVNPSFSLYLPATCPVVTINVFFIPSSIFMVDKLIIANVFTFFSGIYKVSLVVCIFYVCMCLNCESLKNAFPIRKIQQKFIWRARAGIFSHTWFNHTWFNAQRIYLKSEIQSLSVMSSDPAGYRVHDSLGRILEWSLSFSTWIFPIQESNWGFCHCVQILYNSAIRESLQILLLHPNIIVSLCFYLAILFPLNISLNHIQLFL